MSDVPEGYKMSEVGVIPKDWGVKELGKITNILVGKDLKEDNFSSYADNIFKYPVYSNTVDNEGLYGYYNIAEYQGDSLSVVGRGVGLGTAFKRNGGYGAIGRLLLLFPDINVDSKYLCEYINHKVKIFKESSGIPQLTGISLAKYNIPLPPTIEEQQAIASTLSDVDALITALEQLITKKRNTKQGAMQQLLTGKKRLPGFGGEWEVKKLGEIADIISGGTPSTIISEFWNGDIKWCTPTDITRTKRKYLAYTEKTISEKGLKNSSATLLPVGALLLCSRATIGEIRIAKDVVCTNQGFKSLVCKKSFDNQFVYYLLLQSKQKLIDKAIGSTFLEISKKDTDAIKLTFPSFPEQQAITQILSDMDAEIESLEQKRNKYKAIKQGMMQELLTGKTRLV